MNFQTEKDELVASLNIEVVFENRDFLVVNKPPGLIVHSDGRSDELTLVDWVLEKYPEISGVGEDIEIKEGNKIIRPGIVHRLDKETSGVLVIAKNNKSFNYLKNLFKERLVEKTYLCFVYGQMKEDKGKIERQIGRSRKDFRLFSAQRGAVGKLRGAVTDYEVLLSNERASFVKVKPKTGRTHQIRVHFKAINYPIVCDFMYAPKQKCILGFSRLALHSSCISFVTENGKKMSFSTLLPKDFIVALDTLGNVASALSLC
jgi:23S rRNA pseudouridine1911/1915/1917 synthase